METEKLNFSHAGRIVTPLFEITKKNYLLCKGTILIVNNCEHQNRLMACKPMVAKLRNINSPEGDHSAEAQHIVTDARYRIINLLLITNAIGGLPQFIYNVRGIASGSFHVSNIIQAALFTAIVMITLVRGRIPLVRLAIITITFLVLKSCSNVLTRGPAGIDMPTMILACVLAAVMVTSNRFFIIAMMGIAATSIVVSALITGPATGVMPHVMATGDPATMVFDSINAVIFMINAGFGVSVLNRTITRIFKDLNAKNLEMQDLQRMLTINESKFREIFNQSFQFAAILNRDGVLITANKTSLDFIGAVESDVTGRYYWDTPWWYGENTDELKNAISSAAGANPPGLHRT